MQTIENGNKKKYIALQHNVHPNNTILWFTLKQKCRSVAKNIHNAHILAVSTQNRCLITFYKK